MRTRFSLLGKTLHWIRIFSLILVCRVSYLRAAELEPAAPLPPTEAASSMIVPDGFNVSLFAGEPDVKQPIGFCIDDRGRLWVAEAYNYPNHGTKPGDRILIFEDVDGDGRFDERTVFYDELNYVTGIEVGFGGAWVVSPPYFYFIADRDGDDQPDAAPEVLLDGFGNHANAHNLANGLAWGPDGWLYGTHGRTNWSLLGKPGTPDEQRIRFDGGVYRYHPIRHEWEPYADGTTNPWGIDWNDYGEAFICNCVNPHLFHVIQGAHYEPWRNRESSRYAYRRIPTIADHLHFTGRGNIRDGLGTREEDLVGGGHAHCGTMVYLGDNWPSRYRNSVFMNNIHGRRINNDLLTRNGSGYTASHCADFMVSKDPWFMGVSLQYGPDGAVYAIDWSDTGECHSVKNTRRHTGRIYKISHGIPKLPDMDPRRMSGLELVRLQEHQNDWFVRHARRLLQERMAAGADMSLVHERLRALFFDHPRVTVKLRALWALHVTDGLGDQFLVELLDDGNEYITSWAIRLLCEDRDPPLAALRRFRRLAADGDSQLVRLYLASSLQRLRPRQKWRIASALMQRSEDAGDANIPLMIWYGIEPLIDSDIEAFANLVGTAKIPLIRRHVARRIASHPRHDAGLNALVRVIHSSDASQLPMDVLGGMLKGLEGRRSATMPKEWPAVYKKLRNSPSQSVRRQSLELALIFDDPVAIDSLRSLAADRSKSARSRNQAIAALVRKKVEDLPTLLLSLVRDRATQRMALRGLAEFDHPATAKTIVEGYATLNESAKRDALQTLASRVTWASHLMDAVQSNQIPTTDITAYTARQIQNLGNDRLNERIRSSWGEIRVPAGDKVKLIEKYKSTLTDNQLRRADRAAGQKIYDATCANCHRLFGRGNQIGPDITGSQRSNVDYMLENLVDPSAIVSNDYMMEIVELVSGRIITGLVTAEDDNAITIQTINEKVVVPLAEIDRRSTSKVSMMPDGMLRKLSMEEVRNLFAYLAAPE